MGIVAALALIIGAMLAAILWACGGHLIYSLDDPYISLSLGWHIGHAHYGINTGEPASPSSSILFPFLLACFAWASWQQWVPFIVNAAAAVGTGLAFGAALCRYGIVNRPSQIPRACMFVVAVCLAINTVGLVFTGLEHSLHALTSVFVLLALARVLEEDRVRPSLIAAIVLLPLWRFEGMALAILALAALMIAGHRRPATIGILAVGLTVGAYMATLHLMGLPLLPSSVLSKSAVARDTVDRSLGAMALLGSIVHNASRSLNREAVPLFVLLALVLAHPALRVLRRANEGPTTWNLWRELVFTAVVAGVLIAHLLFGGWGTLARYTAYAAAAGTVGALVLWRGPIIKFMGQKSALLDGLVLVGLFDIGAIYLTATAVTPASALGIFEQQYQMHRFVVDYYRRPVAVNDLVLRH